MPAIDLNCDLGEDPAAIGRDVALLEFVTSANVACGGHAGNEELAGAIVAAAKARGCGVGAHPGYPDPANFGRVPMRMASADLEASIQQQIATLARIAAGLGVELRHVKPHGALYHAANHQPDVAAAIARAAARAFPGLILVAQAGSPALETYARLGMRTAAEAFADRRYEPDGSLRSRTLADALIHNPAAAAAQALRIARGEGVIAIDGGIVLLRAGTICMHSDTPGAALIAGEVRRVLESAGVRVAPIG